MKTLRPFTAPHADYDDGLFYPSSGGPDEPSADAVLVTRRLIREALADYFALDLDVYVGSGIPWYSGRGVVKPLCRPDAFVAFGVRLGERASWHLKREVIIPAVCLHVETRSNRAAVLGPIKDQCERLGVKEYLVFSHDRVAGFRLRGRRYRGIRPDGDGGVRARLLGLRLVNEYCDPRFVEAATGEVVLTRHEQAIRNVRTKQAELTPRTGD
jgi:hypothetical protein